MARRAKYKIAVDNYDLPITPKYIDALKNAGAKIHNMSKWNNTVVVETPDSLLCNKIKQLPFVSNVRHVWTAPDSVDAPNFANRQKEVTNRPDTLEQLYGKGFEQISQLNALRLHEAGFTGKGVTIAVLDGGFHNADCITAWRKEQILGTRNFVRPERSVYDELSHGMMVLSCIASPRRFVLPHRVRRRRERATRGGRQLVRRNRICRQPRRRHCHEFAGLHGL